MNVSLLTDMYELTMLQAAIKDGTANRKATFEVFARSLPEGFRYGVFAGLGRLLPMIEEFRFDSAELDWLGANKIIDAETVDYLRDYRFSGTVTAYREGDLYFPHSPVLTVEGTFGECVLLETMILSVINADSAIATKAARMVSEANGRRLIEMGSRRTHERSAVDAARAAYIAGFASTSNLQAGMTYGVPVAGTAAHAWTLAHDNEAEAFASQIDALGVGTTLLVDTYDIEQGIANAVEAAKGTLHSVTDKPVGPGAVRIDSGDFFHGTFRARKQLDALGATETKIVVSGDMDEYTMKDLRDCPIDGFGVGAKLVSTPPSGFVYKLVEIETEGGHGSFMKRVAKKSKGKNSVGGKKTAYRVYDKDGQIAREVYAVSNTGEVWEAVKGSGEVRMLNNVVMEGGRADIEAYRPDKINDIRDFHASEKALLPEGEQRVWVGTFDPFLVAEFV